ncbi:MAG: Maf family nucleotide pyrophosphatase [Gammaproteobacteria bacterium]
MPSTTALILASTSPYRRELLGRLRLPFIVEAPGIDETPLPGETPPAAARRLARAKAEAVSARHPTALVIGSDQTATLDGTLILGKPGGHEAARAQLRAASGRSLVFHTALAVVRSADSFGHEQVVETRVRFRRLAEEEIEAYLLDEQPYDCAGSAKNEGLGIALLERIESTDPTALTGLPLIALVDALRRVGVSPLAQAPSEREERPAVRGRS